MTVLATTIIDNREGNTLLAALEKMGAGGMSAARRGRRRSTPAWRGCTGCEGEAVGALQITDPNHYLKVRDAIAEDLALSAFLLELVRGISATVPEYYQAMNRAGTFWHVTQHSHYVSLVIILHRVFEREGGKSGQTMSFPNLLDTVAGWLKDGTLRPKGASVSWKAIVERHYRADEIEADLLRAAEGTKRLAQLRHTEVAHRNYKAFINGLVIDDPTLVGYLQETINLGFSLVDKYSRFSAMKTNYPRILRDGDGYPFVLRAIAELDRREPWQAD